MSKWPSKHIRCRHFVKVQPNMYKLGWDLSDTVSLICLWRSVALPSGPADLEITAYRSTDYTSLYSPISNIRVVTKCTISLVDIWLEKLLKLRYSSTANHWLLWSDTLNLFLRDFKELEFYILTISGIRAWVCGGTVGRRYYKSVSVITSVYRNYCDQKKIVNGGSWNL